MDIYRTWEIHPNKEPDLHFNDWTEGFKDAEKLDIPLYLNNKSYMMGWYNSKGMIDGYHNYSSLFHDNIEYYMSYIEGYQSAQYEKSCH